MQNAVTNSNVYGIILAYNIRVKCKDVAKGYYLLSLLLFLDVRTARVERYLMNSSDPIANEKGIDFKEDLFYI
jgi:hypothetical protein